MPLYPPPLEERFTAGLAAIIRRLDRLEARTAAIDSGWPLAALPGVIDPSYTSGDPMAYVNGSDALTGPYRYFASYTPAANDNVVVLPLGGTSKTYVILGKPA